MGGAAALWAALVVGSVAPAAATPLPLAKPAATSSAAAPVSPAPSVPGSAAPSEDGPAVADPAPAVAAVPIPVTPGAPAKVLFGQVMTPAAMQALRESGADPSLLARAEARLSMKAGNAARTKNGFGRSRIRNILNEEIEFVWGNQKPPKLALDTAVLRAGDAFAPANP